MTDTQLLGVVCLGVACALFVWLFVKADRGADRRAEQHRQALKRLFSNGQSAEEHHQDLKCLFPDGQPERDPDDQHLLDLYFPRDPPAAAGLTSERKRLERAIVVPFRKSAS